ncbi:MAG: hypothetical protein HXN48_07975 [Prevotella nanceiensis]|uniref:hypothetical protein n=1 Tax=Hoylesella nanceiensis TaxID=425941 RepID=UPI001CADC9D5|nr:hypothetical protein [Hoylesella nanceiensis]MBF1438363.1 hypothetical protein [Hoylesella nanceiensis]
MKHKEFLKAVSRECSFVKRLIKSRRKREREINKIVAERFKHLVTKWCKIEDKYYYLLGFEGGFVSKNEEVFVKGFAFELFKHKSPITDEIRGFSLEPAILTLSEIEEAEKNQVSKEEAFKYIDSLVDDMECRY